jgi:hypothetical protein
MTAVTTDLCGAALAYAARGWPVFPLHAPDERGRCSCGDAACGDVGKHPRTAHGFKDATTDPEAIRRWWARWPDANIGLPAEAAGLAVLDIDPRHGGDDSRAAFEAEHGALPATVESLTGGGGRHLCFRHPGGRVASRAIAPGLDIKADGGYIVAPPSRHASGRRYAWEVSSHPEDVPLAPLPPALLSRVRAQAKRQDEAERRGECEPWVTPLLRDGSPQGRRNKDGTRLAGYFRGRDVGRDIAATILYSWADRCRPPLDHTEVDAILTSVWRYQPGVSFSPNGHGEPAGPANQSNRARPGFALTPLAALLAEPPEAVAWVVDGLLIAGGVSILGAKPKVGKSTLARNVALAVARGAPFFGRAAARGAVVYLALEEKRAEVGKHFARMGAADEPIVVHVGSAPEEALGALTAALAEHRPALAIVDPLLKLVRLRDANDYAEVSRALEPLLDLARATGCHLLCLHHLGKGERSGGDAVLGSTALFGAVDTLLLMKRAPEGQRTIETIQRYGDDLPATVVRLDPETGLVSAAGDVAALKLAEAGKAVLEALGDETLTEADIRERAGGNQSLASKALRALVDEERVARSGSGKRNDPYLYSVARPAGESLPGSV